MDNVTFEHHFNIEHVDDCSPKTVIQTLYESLEKNAHSLTKGQLKDAINKGALWLTRGQHTQRLRRLKKVLKEGDTLHLYYNTTVLANEVTQAILISDEDHYSVWYKPYGMLSQGSKWSDHCTISRFAQQHLKPERPVFIVHRLDKAATGLIIIAHSKKAARAFSALFEHRSKSENSLEKMYQIIVHGDHRQFNQPQIINTKVDEKTATSTFTCLDYNNKTEQSLVNVKIDSGRKHQIRIHAASIGLPVVGDRLHGVAGNKEEKNLQLCAISLRFICPFTQENKHFEINSSLKPQLF